MLKWRACHRWISRLLLLGLCAVFVSAARAKHDNCKSEKLRELVLETVGIYPHQYSYQAKSVLLYYLLGAMCSIKQRCSRYMKQQAEERFGNWWSAVIVGDRGGYGMSAVYDKYRNTR
ncbi:hypothetical protein ANCDUO_00882 [Ancylostoma duodenale]|uniref:Uncharacterized protein n=1 Tax=Ancylostoma duodenale TaxID=51022 RepID=A0A0C2HAW1_9BILA|nr:hypothetical protein ANCDUO_00882 [Ancylostoma duodenale]